MQRERLAVARGAAEAIEAPHRVGQRVERRGSRLSACGAPSARRASASSSLRCAESSSTSRASSRVAAVAMISPRKPCAYEQRNAPAMIEVRVSEQHDVDVARIEAEVGAVFLVDLLAPLVEAAIDQQLQAARLEPMAGAGDSRSAPWNESIMAGRSHRVPVLAALSRCGDATH